MLKNLEIRISLISADYKSIFAFAHFQWFVMLLSRDLLQIQPVETFLRGYQEAEFVRA